MDWQQLGPELPRGGNRVTMMLGRLAMRLIHWRIEGEFPNVPKVIVAVAPHTSNVDFILSIAIIWGLGLKASYLAKKSLFDFPFGRIMTALGAIPVDRRSPQGMVEQLTQQFGGRSQLVLGITPEGTRSNARGFRSGFALIAQSANVPILPAIINYDTKVVTFRDLITNVSDAESTLEAIQQAAASGAPRKRPPVPPAA
jgi:1-acyl-sn-glycerol-3-phosphate acyltransferase